MTSSPAGDAVDGLISFVGAGPGAADLITLRGANRLARADVVIWAASLVPEAVLEHCRAGVELHDSKAMTLDDVTAVYAAHPAAAIVRLHSGDPAVYSAIGEQMAWCVAHDRAFEVVPGVSSLAAAAAAARCELTVPAVAQSVVMTRVADRTAASMAPGEDLAALARPGVTMAVFLSAARPEALQAELLAPASSYGPDTPAVIAWKASWPEERLVRTTVGQLATELRTLGARATVLVLVGEALDPGSARAASRVYSADFGHAHRSAAAPAVGPPRAAEPTRVAEPLSVVGIVGGECFGAAARTAIAGADVVVGSARHLADVDPPAHAGRVDLRGPLGPILDQIAGHLDAGRAVCLLSSGDPGFFGIVRLLGVRFGVGRFAVHPAPSSVSLAFARVGLSWEDAAVVSAHGRSLADAVAAAVGPPKVAVLTSPDNPPQRVGAALLEAGCGPRRVAVVSRIGEPGESCTQTDLVGLAAGTFDPLSVVVLEVPEGRDAGPGLAWGLPEDAFAHRAGMITKAEARAVALGKLALPATGVLWDLGAGSGSVAIECARLRPGLAVVAVERVAADAERIVANAAAHGVEVEVVVGAAPDALAGLPDPDRVFVGGGGLAVLDAALARLRPGGVVVANYALVDRAAAAWERLGNLVQVSVARGVPVASVGVRLEAENPIFVCWGPEPIPAG